MVCISAVNDTRTVRTFFEQYRTFDTSNFEKDFGFELYKFRTFELRTSNFEFKYRTLVLRTFYAIIELAIICLILICKLN